MPVNCVSWFVNTKVSGAFMAASLWRIGSDAAVLSSAPEAPGSAIRKATWEPSVYRACSSISSDPCSLTAWTERGESQGSLRSGMCTVMQEAWDWGAHFLITVWYRCCELWGDGTPKNTHCEVISPPVMVVGAGSAEVTARVLPIPCGNRGVEGGPRPGLLISNSADAEENAKYLKNFLIFFRILSNQSTNFFF